jgi:hypothetical protein
MWGRPEISLTEYRAARAEVIKRVQSERKATVRPPASARSDLGSLCRRMLTRLRDRCVAKLDGRNAPATPARGRVHVAAPAAIAARDPHMALRPR